MAGCNCVMRVRIRPLGEPQAWLFAASCEACHSLLLVTQHKAKRFNLQHCIALQVAPRVCKFLSHSCMGRPGMQPRGRWLALLSSSGFNTSCLGALGACSSTYSSNQHEETNIALGPRLPPATSFRHFYGLTTGTLAPPCRLCRGLRFSEW